MRFPTTTGAGQALHGHHAQAYQGGHAVEVDRANCRLEPHVQQHRRYLRPARQDGRVEQRAAHAVNDGQGVRTLRVHQVHQQPARTRLPRCRRHMRGRPPLLV